MLDRLESLAERVDRLCELNVVEQVVHVARTTIVRDAWRRGQPVALHGWVYGLRDGLLNDLGIEGDSAAAVDAGYARAVARLSSPSG